MSTVELIIPSEADVTETQTPPVTDETPRRRRGFAAMDRNKVSEIARKGGLAAQRMGVAHRWSQDEAREAGRKGGRAMHAPRKTVKS